MQNERTRNLINTWTRVPVLSSHLSPRKRGHQSDPPTRCPIAQCNAQVTDRETKAAAWGPYSAYKSEFAPAIIVCSNPRGLVSQSPHHPFQLLHATTDGVYHGFTTGYRDLDRQLPLQGPCIPNPSSPGPAPPGGHSLPLRLLPTCHWRPLFDRRSMARASRERRRIAAQSVPLL